MTDAPEYCGPHTTQEALDETDRRLLDIIQTAFPLTPRPYADLGTLLGINVRDNVISAPRDFVEDNGLSYPSIYDPPFVNAVALGGIPASVIPTTIILDREHRPAVVFLKEVSESELWDAVRKVADEGGGA